ncbi:MAG: glycosyltransferase family 4 protein [Thermoproteota archaeon]
MKVTIFQFEKLSGYDTYIFDFAKVLTESGHSVTVVTSNQMPLIGNARALSKKGIIDRLCGSRWIELNFLRFFPSLYSFYFLRKLLEFSDVVYVKNEVLDLIPILLAKRHVNISIICGIHTPLHYFNWNSLRANIHNIVYSSTFYRSMLSACDLIHVLNVDDKDFLKNVFHIEKSKIRMVPLWIDHEKFKLQEKSFSKSFRILFIGRLDMRKGIDILLKSIVQIAKIFHDKFSKMSFTIVGKGPFENQIREIQERYGNVKYLKFVTDNIVLYKEHDILVLPSRAETFSYVTLEALTCGLPVIASDIPGPRSLIENGKTGILVPVGNSSALSKAILSMYELWTSKDEYNRIGNYCRQSVLKRFPPESTKKAFVNLIESIGKR